MAGENTRVSEHVWIHIQRLFIRVVITAFLGAGAKEIITKTFHQLEQTLFQLTAPNLQYAISWGGT
jgi:hypothetical protein